MKRILAYLRRECPECEGCGEVRAWSGPTDLRICERCGGTGRRSRKRERALDRMARDMERMELEYERYLEKGRER